MSQLEVRDVPPVGPLYEQQAVDEPIVLGRVAVEVLVGADVYPGSADVRIDFEANEMLVFDVTHSAKRLFGLSMMRDADVKLRLPERGVVFPAIETNVNRFTPRNSVVTATVPAKNIRRCVFHLFNFPAFFSTTDYVLAKKGSDSPVMERCGRVILRGGGWCITIAATGRTDDDDQALTGKRGWKTTHAAEIVRDDGSDFSSEQVQDVMLCLYYCLSFALGRWVAVALPVGLAADGARVFEEWGFPKASGGRWHGGSSWFDDHDGDALAQLFPGFWAMWNKELWKRSLREAIYWYLGAADRGVGVGVDTGLILSQTALEHLAWTYCVRDRGMVSADAFKPRGLSAANKFRLLASSLGLPKTIPPQMRALGGKPGKQWADAMDAITGVRNATVHPEDDSKFPDGTEYEAWALSLWYLDMIILRLCDYNGKYGNRLHPTRWAGQVDPVPWTVGGP